MTAHSISTRNVRTYLAGTGATGALIVGAIVAFLSVAALFAVNGLPGDSAPAEDESLFVGAAGAPVAAATAVAAAPDAVAADAAPLPPAALAALAAGPGGGAPPGAPEDFVPPVGGGSPPVPSGGGGPVTTASAPGPIGGLVDGVDQATGNPGLGPATKPITDPIDQTLQQNLPGVSDAVDQIGQGATDTANGILGGGN